MKNKEELNALKKEVETLKKKLAELTDEELEQISGGMSEIDEAIMNGTVMGHLLNARQSAQRTGNLKLISETAELLTKCTSREYALIVSKINELLPVGVYDSSDNAAYDSLKKAKETIESSGVLNA